MNAGFYNTGMVVDGVQQPQGFYARLDHYESWMYFWTKEIYEITTSKVHPLTFVDETGDWWFCDFHYWSDWGSIPPPWQGVPGFDRERHKFPYMFHDNSYQEKGLWRSHDENATREFVPMTRLECDLFLARAIKYDIIPGGPINIWFILRGVRIGGGREFGKGDWKKRNSTPTNRIDPMDLPIKFA